jgi:hypothetical protein
MLGRNILSLLCFCAALHAAASVHAQGKAKEQAQAQTSESYEQLIVEGIAEYDAKNWQESRALFKRAYELYPNARAARGAALAEYQARAYVAAYHDIMIALADKAKPLTPKQRTELERMLVTTRTFISRVPVELEPADASLSVDGSSAALTDGELWLDPGEHDITAQAPGYESDTQRVKAAPGESLQLRFALRPTTNEVAQQATPAPAAATPTQRSAADGPRFGAWPWVAAGVAVVFAGTAIGMHVASANGADAVREQCPQDACSVAEIDDAIASEKIELFDALAVTSWVLAGVGAAASVTLFVLDAGSDDQRPASASASTRRSVRLSAGPGSVALSGRF